MVLESLEPKENDKVLKKKLFSKFWGLLAPLKPPFLGFWGVLGGAKPPKILKKFVLSKCYHFLWGLSFPEPSSYLIFNFGKCF